VDNTVSRELGGFPWLQALVCVNPLIYVTEGFRAALTTTGHMHLYVIYPVLLGLSALFLWAGIRASAGGSSASAIDCHARTSECNVRDNHIICLRRLPINVLGKMRVVSRVGPFTNTNTYSPHHPAKYISEWCRPEPPANTVAVNRPSVMRS